MCSIITSEPRWLTKWQHTPTLPYICKFSEQHNQLCLFSVWTAVVWLTFRYSLETINPWIQPTLPGTSLQQGPGHLENFYQYGDQGQRTSQFPVTHDTKSNAARGNGGGQTCPTKTSHTVNLCMNVSQEDKHSQQWTRSVNKTLPSGYSLGAGNSSSACTYQCLPCSVKGEETAQNKTGVHARASTWVFYWCAHWAIPSSSSSSLLLSKCNHSSGQQCLAWSSKIILLYGKSKIGVGWTARRHIVPGDQGPICVSLPLPLCPPAKNSLFFWFHH